MERFAMRPPMSRQSEGTNRKLGSVVSSWIYDENFRLVMDPLAHLAGASFADDDWRCLEHYLLLRRDQLDQERHIQWPLGTHTIHLYYQPGSSAVSFQIEADHDFELRADTLVYPLQQVVIHSDR